MEQAVSCLLIARVRAARCVSIRPTIRRRMATWSRSICMTGPAPACPAGRSASWLGSLKSERAVSLIAIHNHEIPFVFSDAALKEAEAAQEPTLEGREDWRSIPLITIDPADAKDHDDAVHAEADPDPENPGGFILHIAIADVAAYVSPFGARSRGAFAGAIRSISRIASCRCCPSASRTTCAR